MIDYLKDFSFEFNLRMAGRTKPDTHAYKLWEQAKALYSGKDLESLVNAFEFSLSIDYHHAGLSSEIYYPHVLRVAALSGLAMDGKSLKSPIIGLLHNSLEVSHLTKADLEKKFSREIAEAVSILTVDRSKQWDQLYKEEYYKRISEFGQDVRLVKAMDKLDNIFLLHLNPDTLVKQRYRKEIYEFVMPLIRDDFPDLHLYIHELMLFSLKKEGPNYAH